MISLLAVKGGGGVRSKKKYQENIRKSGESMCVDLCKVLVGLGLVQQLGGHEADDLVVPQQDIQRVLSSR